MQKSFILILVIALAATQALYGSTGEASRTVTTNTDHLAEESVVGTHSLGNRNSSRDTLLSADAEVGATMYGSASPSVIEPNGTVEGSEDQIGTGTSKAPSQQPRHKHHLRNALIAFGACFALALVIAVASK